MRRQTRLLTIAAAVATSAGAAALIAVPTAGAASAAPASAATRCAESQLRATVDPRHIPGNGTLGPDGRSKHAVLIDFENTSTRTCTLYGYPGAAIVGFDGSQIRQATRTTHGNYGGTKPTTVTVRPRHYAAAFLEGEKSSAPGNCGENYPRILVTPPNTARPVGFTVGWPKCYSFLVHPVQALRSAP